MSIRHYMAQMVALRKSLPGGGMPTGWGYSCIEDYVLDRGVAPKSEALTPEEDAILWAAVDAVGGRFQQKQCYYNAQLLCLRDPSESLEYREGIAQGNAVIPVQHAWVEINGKAIDLTWRGPEGWHRKGRLGNRIIGTLPEGWEYLGCPFDKELLRARVIEKSAVWAVLGDYMADFPHLRGERKSA